MEEFDEIDDYPITPRLEFNQDDENDLMYSDEEINIEIDEEIDEKKQEELYKAKKQKLYEKYMNWIPSVFVKMISSLPKKPCDTPEDAGKVFIEYLSKKMESLYKHIQEAQIPFHGKLVCCKFFGSFFPMLEQGYFLVRKSDLEVLSTPLSVDTYPLLGDLLITSIPYFKNKLMKNENGMLTLKESENIGMIPTNEYSNIQYDRMKKCFVMYHAFFSRFEELYKKIGEIWCDLCENGRDWKNIREEKEIRKKCYKLFWLIANMCPYRRGSAATAKVVLNMALTVCGLPIVMETFLYRKQADWVAMLNTFENFYEMVEKNEIFNV